MAAGADPRRRADRQPRPRHRRRGGAPARGAERGGVTLIVVTHDRADRRARAPPGADGRRRDPADDAQAWTAGSRLMRTTDIARLRPRRAPRGSPLRTRADDARDGDRRRRGGRADRARRRRAALRRRPVLGDRHATSSSCCRAAPRPAASTPPTAITSTPRDLTVDDARALPRAPRGAAGRAARRRRCRRSRIGGRLREVDGRRHDRREFLEVRRMALAQGRFLPRRRVEPRLGGDACSAPKLRTRAVRQPAGARPAACALGDRRFRVIGVLAPAGQGLGMNTDELAIVPVALRAGDVQHRTRCSASWSRRAAATRSSRARARRRSRS